MGRLRVTIGQALSRGHGESLLTLELSAWLGTDKRPKGKQLPPRSGAADFCFKCLLCCCVLPPRAAGVGLRKTELRRDTGGLLLPSSLPPGPQSLVPAFPVETGCICGVP